jgi:hypothetical protein
MLCSFKQYKGAWIGLGDAESENTFKWEGSQQLATYNNWDTNEPNNGGAESKEEDCVEIAPTKKWNDYNCKSTINYFCERPLSSKIKSIIYVNNV